MVRDEGLNHFITFTGDSTPDDVNLETTLEQIYPATGLRDKLARLDNLSLIKFVATEPFHTNAVHTGWLLLAERIITGSPWLQSATADSRHANPKSAVKIRRRLETLSRICRLRGASLPDALQVSISLSKILVDPWASPKLRNLLHQGVPGG